MYAMECNREEAIRAREIAIKKLENNDFLGAKRLANKTDANKTVVARSILPSAFMLAFWTICPHCHKHFLYHQRNLLICCRVCGKNFFAFKLHEQAIPSRFLLPSASNYRSSSEMFSRQYQQAQYYLSSTEEDMMSEPMSNAAQTGECIKWDDRAGVDGQINHLETRRELSHLAQGHHDVNFNGIRNRNEQDTFPVSEAAVSSSPQRLAKRKQDDGAYTCCSLSSSTNKRERKCTPLSSVGSSYMQILNDKSDVSLSAEHHVPSILDRHEERNEKHDGNQHNCRKETSDTASPDSDNPVIAYHYPDFFDFGKVRDVNRIAVDQIWALYDEHDFMPRVYARIDQINTSNLKVQFTWLAHKAMSAQEAKWSHEELPVACGNFCLGETGVLQDPSMYLSHSVSWTKGKDGKSYEIHPNKGEVWALYKGWSMQWSSDADNHRSYGYDIVQILSNDSMDGTVSVFPLVRMEGFVSLFAKAKDKTSFSIPSSELLRFSHSIPFHTTNGNEKVGIVEGLLELDTAALPSDLNSTFPSVILDKKTDTEFISCTYPVSEFHNFGESRSFDNDHDKFPKFYGWISEVKLKPLRLHLTWLEVCPELEQEKQWLEKDIPISCGTFKIGNCKVVCDSTSAFSHLVETSLDLMNRQTKIFPKVGEIWAIYKNWSPDWAPSRIQSCLEYDVGKIIRCTEGSTLFSFLTKVDGYGAVFKPDIGKGILKIPEKENLRFSHRIPSFSLAKQKGTRLSDFYELDPASVPDVFLQKE
uniref:DUF3444 domain-containing protein n=1 Tax=Leersia perrieri TaxID=77586 RepID=A0A0D9XTI2_9ORYZ